MESRSNGEKELYWCTTSCLSLEVTLILHPFELLFLTQKTDKFHQLPSHCGYINLAIFSPKTWNIIYHLTSFTKNLKDWNTRVISRQKNCNTNHLWMVKRRELVNIVVYFTTYSMFLLHSLCTSVQNTLDTNFHTLSALGIRLWVCDLCAGSLFVHVQDQQLWSEEAELGQRENLNSDEIMAKTLDDSWLTWEPGWLQRYSVCGMGVGLNASIWPIIGLGCPGRGHDFRWAVSHKWRASLSQELSWEQLVARPPAAWEMSTSVLENRIWTVYCDIHYSQSFRAPLRVAL